MKYANMQYKYLFLEEARNTFESLLKNHPKRSDLWLVYVDKELKFGTIDKVRLIFEKIFTVDFKVKVLKAIVKKYLEVEMKHGNAKSLENAKMIAQLLITQKLAQMSEMEEAKNQMEGEGEEQMNID